MAWLRGNETMHTLRTLWTTKANCRKFQNQEWISNLHYQGCFYILTYNDGEENQVVKSYLWGFLEKRIQNSADNYIKNGVELGEGG